MEKFENAVGIDVSKLTLDAHDYEHFSHVQLSNDEKGFKGLVKWIKKLNKDKNTVICFEHTGLYSLPLAMFLTENQIPFFMVPGLEVRRSLGIRRGKSDKADAEDISRYAFLRREEIKLYELPSQALLKLRGLLSLREKMVKQKAGYQATMKEMKRVFNQKDNPIWFKSQQKIFKELREQINTIEAELLQIIQEDDRLKKLFELVCSVKGVGLVTGVSFIVYTNAFTSFDDWRSFASYSGTAPFEYQSGTSIKGKTKVSHLANKKMKALLSNAASCSIRYSTEMRLYYQRRLEEGKNKMSTQNIIRNKIIARVFAVVNRGTPYVDVLKHAA